MSDRIGTAIAALLYAEPPGLDFAAFTDAFGAALADTAGAAVRRREGYDDLAIYAVAGARIGLGFCDGAAVAGPFSAGRGGPAAALVVAVGPDDAAGDGFAPHAADLSTRLVDLIARLVPPDSVLRIVRDDLFTPDAFDEVAAAIWPPHPAGAAALPEAEVVAWAPAQAGGDGPGEGRSTAGERPEAATAAPAEARRVRRAVQGRAAAPVAGPEPANDRPDLPRPMHDEMARVRAALYAPLGPDEAPPQLSLVQRATVYCFNGTLIALCLPVGAAMFVYSALGRENPRVAARAVAITGTALGFLKMFAGGLGLPFA